jgi:hypothetical protein
MITRAIKEQEVKNLGDKFAKAKAAMSKLTMIKSVL